MANSLHHSSVGTSLTQAEYEAIDGHVIESQATGDILYAASATSLRRLGISATATHFLGITGGIPAWKAVSVAGSDLTGTSLASGIVSSSLTTVGTIATGVWQGTDVGVAYGGTGASTLTANGVLIGNGTGAVTAVDQSTKGHILIGDGSGNPQMLAVGSNDYILTADSGETTGVKWAAAGAAAAGSLTGATLASGVTASSLTSVGALGGGSIASGFGAIDIGSDNLTATGTVSLGATTLSGNLNFNNNVIQNVGAAGNDWGANYLYLVNSESGGSNTIKVDNTATAANSHALFYAIADGTGAGDAYLRTRAGGHDFVMGVDNSADAFVIANQTAPNGTDIIRIANGSTTTLFPSGGITVGVDDTGYDVTFYGAATGKYWLWDESASAMKFVAPSDGSSFMYFDDGAEDGWIGYVHGTTRKMRFGVAGGDRLSIDSTGVAAGDQAPTANFSVDGTGDTIAGLTAQMVVWDTTTMQAGVGGKIIFSGWTNAGTNVEPFAAIGGYKLNGTADNDDGKLKVWTRPDGDVLTVAADWDEAGNLSLENNELQNVGGAANDWTATKLTTNAIKITTGAGADKVLTSDANGDATWETAGGGGAVELAGSDTSEATASNSTSEWTMSEVGSTSAGAGIACAVGEAASIQCAIRRTTGGGTGSWGYNLYSATTSTNVSMKLWATNYGNLNCGGIFKGYIPTRSASHLGGFQIDLSLEPGGNSYPLQADPDVVMPSGEITRVQVRGKVSSSYMTATAGPMYVWKYKIS